ncbi:hypothetical protein [Nitrososphaera sp.]|uniref:hypothetical protein n=1 Tax=Nitrososphaera sp. TaxID=1971748 RepID=UPI0017D71B71|nr:hypothetical protein [Nitrososphaera sp.]NWG36996.1 hypothetical protein [Nitrososphaera sp.]
MIAVMHHYSLFEVAFRVVAIDHDGRLFAVIVYKQCCKNAGDTYGSAKARDD